MITTAMSRVIGARRDRVWTALTTPNELIRWDEAVVSLVELCSERIDSANLGRFSLGGEWVDVPVCNDADAARLWELSAELTGVGR